MFNRRLTFLFTGTVVLTAGLKNDSNLLKNFKRLGDNTSGDRLKKKNNCKLITCPEMTCSWQL